MLATPTSSGTPRPVNALGRNYPRPSFVPHEAKSPQLHEAWLSDDPVTTSLSDALISTHAKSVRIALIGGFTPRRCGIATFTADIHASIVRAYPETEINVYAMAPIANDIEFAAPVRGVIVENDADSFIAAAADIEASNADVVWLQHEFGLFGGYAGDKIFELLDRIAAPLIVTLHTVMPDPDPDQLRVMQRIVARATKLMVMSERAAMLLRETFGADANQIEVIHHGVPDRPFGRTEQFKTKLGFTGRQVLMTFGLLSPGKGIESVIAALPQIVAAHPNVVYCIVGATHPNLLAREGEAYRRRLQNLAIELKVDDHIHWIDAFMETEALLDLIEAADVYLTPYHGANQATSGTLSYALALGKAIVSTPYAHASELLADDHGVLVPFNDPATLASEVDALLNAPDRLLAIRQRAYYRGRSMIWPEFAIKCMDAITATRVPDNTRCAALSTPLGIEGLLRICDGTGIIQHSIFCVPDRAHGYCLDDNARALMLMNRIGEGAEPHRSRLASVFAGFVQSSWNEDSGEFRNFMGYGRNWLESAGSEDSCGRALWALGATAHEGLTPSFQQWARRLFDITAFSARGFRSPRSHAFAMLGADYVLASDAQDVAAMTMLSYGAEFLSARFIASRRADWPWFESVLAYDNCRMPEAMIRAGLRLGRPDFTQIGYDTLGWLLDLQTSTAGHFRPIGSDSFGQEYAAPRPFDQQPVEAWAAIDSARAAFDASGNPIWLEHAKRAMDWFAGANDRGIAIGDPQTGSCRDGINPRGVNLNQGAESVLAYQLAHCAFNRMMSKVIAN
jgi:glycosyltransferase involved in cell wall biosynthesis